MSSHIQIALTNEPIDYPALTESVRSPLAGAVVLFLGTVREMTGDRRTVALDYEGYPDMARDRMRALADDACSRWPVVAAAIVHRLGHMELGDISVEAGRFLIDRLKEEVPIWKQENWADGSKEWVHPGVPTV